jgi:hypothetical protein
MNPAKDFESTPPGLSAKEWETILSKIGETVEGELCIIGSGACMFSGMSRTSMDLDVWNPSSNFDQTKLRKAVEAQGLMFNPTEEVVDRPYIQIVEPGIAQTGKFKTTHKMARYGTLKVTRPPIENIIASKLVRGDKKDIEDIGHLSNKFLVDNDKVKAAIQSMPNPQKGKAKENLVFLDVLNPPT